MIEHQILGQGDLVQDQSSNSIFFVLNDTQTKILDLLKTDNTLTGASLADRIGISKRNIEQNIRKIKEKGFIKRHGSERKGYWEVLTI